MIDYPKTADALLDDGPEVVDLDEADYEDDWVDTFDFGSDDRRGVLDIWRTYAPRGGERISYGTRTLDPALQRVIRATRVAQTLVDTFCAGDRPYRISFNNRVRTAGTDFDGRRVVVTSAPLFDQLLTEEQASRVLTGLVVHETDHDRYGRGTYHAAKKAFDRDPLAMSISNVLDDYRIERARAVEYPGLADIYAPTLEWVARQSLAAAGVDEYVGRSLLGTANLVAAAVRYSAWTDWTGAEDERVWWQDWATRYESSKPAVHVAGVREALDRLAAQEPEDEPEPTGEAEGEGEGDQTDGDATGGADQADGDATRPQPTGDEAGDATGGADQAGDATGGEAGDEAGDADQTDGDATEGEGEGAGKSLTGPPTECMTDAAGAYGTDYRDQNAQRLADDLDVLDLNDQNELGEIYRSPKGLRRSDRARTRPAAAAAAVIRRAFVRSRGGHWGNEPHTRTGRLENRSLARVAEGDIRVCHRRTAPSPTRHRVWLLVDCSMSMQGRAITDAVGVASALAAASRFLPNVELEVFGWTTATDRLTSMGATFRMVRVWSSQQPVEDVGYLHAISKGGTPDKAALVWAGKAIRAAARADERPLVIMASDGEGFLKGADVAAVRAAGVDVVSVALGALSEQNQEAMYGAGRYVPWAGSVAATARPLGDLLARLAADTRERRR